MAAANSPRSPVDISEKRIFSCPVKLGKKGNKLVKQDYEHCEDSFSNAFGFQIIETVDNGDCFFHSLSLYSGYLTAKERKKYPNFVGNPAFIPLHKDKQELRDEIVDYLLMYEPELSQVYSTNAIEELREQGVYACDAGDLPPQFASRAFGMNLYIYTFNHDDDLNENYITLVKNKALHNSKVTVNVLHIGNHYKLLWTDNQIATNHLIQKAILDEKVHANEKANRNRNKALKEQKEEAERRTKKNMNLLEKALKASKLAENERKTRKNNAAAAKSRSRSKSKSPNKNITVKGKFQVKSKYAYLLDMTVPQLEGFIRDTFPDFNLPKMTKQNYLNYISDTLNSM
jgi:hypothetical protein